MVQVMASTDLIRALQTRLGVAEDGIYGPATHKTVMAALGPVAAPSARKLAKPTSFYAEVRVEFGPFKQTQVDGFEALLKAMAGWSVEWVAYGLATAWHETACTMQPIKEYGDPAYFKRMYDIQGERPAKARELGNLTTGDGIAYAGRGYPQVTGKANYAMAEKVFGLPFVANPDLMLEPNNAAKVMVHFMERGLFTGKKMADYLPGDYVNARRIINGTDKAVAIALYAKDFEDALRAGEWS